MNSQTSHDCLISGSQINTEDWISVDQNQFIELIGDFAPYGESASDFVWEFTHLSLHDLRDSSEDGDEPEGGWVNAYQSMLDFDAQAVSSGSPERAGRDQWIREVWIKNTDIYPVFAVQDAPGVYRLWDGHHRLAGAFAYKLDRIAVILGVISPF